MDLYMQCYMRLLSCNEISWNLNEIYKNQDFEIRTQKFGVGYPLVDTLLPLSAALCVYLLTFSTEAFCFVINMQALNASCHKINGSFSVTFIFYGWYG